MKLLPGGLLYGKKCRTPHGVRGLKSVDGFGGGYVGTSHPSRGAWIEIISCAKNSSVGTSHPSRGAWIEISRSVAICLSRLVAPLTGCVD